MNLGDYLLLEGNLEFKDPNDYYHKSIYWPEFFTSEIESFKLQVIDMASPKKPFKATDYFKYRAGYPHEISLEQKTKFMDAGIKRDYLTEKENITIPKITIHEMKDIWENCIGFTTPKGGEFIRDAIFYHEGMNDDLVFVYVINRKAQIIASWSVKKKNGKFKLSKPNGIFKSLKYIQE